MFEADFAGRVKARPADRNLPGRSPAGLHASRDSLYRTARSGRQDRAGVTEIPLVLLPRRCPLCGNRTIIGHGRRLKQAHDERHAQIWIRRGLCRPCQKTFTVLPDWLAALGDLQPPLPATGLGVVAPIPDVDGTIDSGPSADASRSPDPSTVRRWAGFTCCTWGPWGHRSSGRPCRLECSAMAPTILAWDLERVLPYSAASRQEVHDPSRSRRVETADSPAGLSTRS